MPLKTQPHTASVCMRGAACSGCSGSQVGAKDDTRRRGRSPRAGLLLGGLVASWSPARVSTTSFASL